MTQTIQKTTRSQEEAGAPKAKKARTAEPSTFSADPAIVSVFYKGLLADSSAHLLAEEFKNPTPYLHCTAKNLVNDELLRKVRNEIWSALHFTEKETDIYKIRQTGDLRNLDGLSEKEIGQLASLFELRNAMYSAEFRRFVDQVTDCGPLSGRTQDMSIASYEQGCHLLNHDDVIGTRRVSYILYLPDPDEPWLTENGGSLELYPVIEDGLPDNCPSKTIPPAWNQMVFFTVQPGHSFHSVEEVVVKDKPRLSISGWFHLPEKGEDGYSEAPASENPSSLQQLQEGLDMPFQLYPTSEASSEEEETEDGFVAAFSKDDTDFLGRRLNPLYLKPTTFPQVVEKFAEDSSIQLGQFLNAQVCEVMKRLIETSDREAGLASRKLPSHMAGTDSDWKIVGPPHKVRYCSLTKTSSESSAIPTDFDPLTAKSAAHLFEGLSHVLIPSQPFRKWVSLLTQQALSSFRGHVRRFRPGLDYTLATTNDEPVLDVTLCFTSGDSSVWESGEVGGYDCYMEPHDGEEDAAIYKQSEDDGALLNTPAGWNVLSLVMRDEGLLQFTKYISAWAPGSRWDCHFEFKCQPQEASDEEEVEQVNIP